MHGTPFGRYRLQELLGRGGMGEVWRAYDTETRRTVAVKVLPAKLADDPHFEQRFRREAFAAASLANPHVVPIHNFGEIDGRLYVDMRLVEGHDLQHILNSGPLPLPRAVSIIEQIASALHAAHRIGLVHRDVKPSNILVDDEDFAYLIDFGIARAAGQSSLTNTGSVIGTWAYMAPERLTKGSTDTRADIYALTCVLHECLTGGQPFKANSLEQQLAAHLAEPPPRPSALKDTVPTAMDPVIAKGMAKNPEERFQTTKELAAAAKTAAVTYPAQPPRPYVPPQPDLRKPPPMQPNYYQPQGFSHADPPQHRPPYQPYQPQPQPYPPSPPPEKKKTGPVIVAVVGIIAVVAAGVTAFLLLGGDDSDPARPSSGDSPAQAEAVPGDFTGVYRVSLAMETQMDGSPWASDAEPAAEETWAVESLCTGDVCVASARRTDGDVLHAERMDFDELDGNWVGVVVSDGGSCVGVDGDVWERVELNPGRDGSLSGEIVTLMPSGCTAKRTLTFTRIDSVSDSDRVSDPADLAPYVAAPADGFSGHYTYVKSGTTTSDVREYDGDVITACLRTAERCMSVFSSPDTGAYLSYADGIWKQDLTYSSTCEDQTYEAHETTEYRLPTPAQDPIENLTGSGEIVVPPGVPCDTWKYDASFERA